MIAIDRDLSLKFKTLSAWAIVSVVIIHSMSISGDSSEWNVFLQWFVAKGLAQWAVPFFFLVSGFWLFHSSVNGFYLKKVRTLLVPYLLWAVIGACIVTPLVVYVNHVGHRDLFASTFVNPHSIVRAIDNLFGIMLHAPVGNGALWYVHTLLAFFLFAPLWKWLAVRCPIVIVALSLMLFAEESFAFPVLAAHPTGWGWSFVGLLVARYDLTKYKVARDFTWFVGILYIGASLVNAYFKIAPSIWYLEWGQALRSAIPLAGIPFVWSLYDMLPRRESLPKWYGQTFWIYCLHQPVCGWLSASFLALLGKSDVVRVVSFATVPIVVLQFCIWTARLVSSKAPHLFAILTGGRSGT